MKINNRPSQNRSHLKLFVHGKIKLLSAVVLGCLANSVGHTTDLEIYQGATYGNASIMMMLDNSGSMGGGSIYEDYPNIYFYNSGTDQLKEKIYSDDGKTEVGSVTFSANYYTNNRGNKYYDRMSRLKMALIPMFANPKSDDAFGKDTDLSKYKIGLGSFYYTSGKNGGKIINPVLDLTLENRLKLIDTVKSLSASTNTPTADAYAEAGAYMLGTNTMKMNGKIYTEAGYSIYDSDKNRYELYSCTNNESFLMTRDSYKFYPCSANKYSKKDNDKKESKLDLKKIGIKSNDEYIIFEAFGKKHYLKLEVEAVIGGFNESSNDTKVKPDLLKYDSPIKGEANQCDGYGIYFLTDGEPNTSTDDTIKLMENSLTGSPLTMGNSCGSGLPSTGKYGGSARWECIGKYSKMLYNKENPKQTLIATATVGFGNVFKQLTNNGKVTKVITRPSGAVEVAQVYQCDADGINQDAKNLCKLGEKGEGYGEGGFYYTEEPKDIADSVRKFIEDVSKAEIDPISAGTMSVPLDSLGGLKSRQFAYLPILEPIPRSPLLWKGNLKKYKVKDATLVGKDDKFVFSDNTGLFAKNTYDLWNTINDTNRADTLRPDQGTPQVGGAYQQIFENANAAIGDRNLFVDSGSSLIDLKVGDNKPVNFDSLTNYTNPQKRVLLSFMGYSEPDNADIKDSKALTSTKDKWLKNIGGVLHSIPQLITQKVDVKASGQFDEGSRKDYIIYGSMDGALHMVDDSTGRETFTFIPKQILDLQPDAISGKGSAIDGSYPYGVDAPWLTYVSYTTKAKTDSTGANPVTTNTYEAEQSFALGGLRMGGSMYYALDVSDVNKPKMIFSVGSNYANRLKGSTDTLQGNKNGALGQSNEQQAYSRMGQTWGKPTLGYVKSGGKRVMVSFLPGGYDTCYENPEFKLNTSYPNDPQCNNKSSAQGNAIYMVQMGEVENNSNKEDVVNTSRNNGKLLWWASNQNNSADYTSRSSSLQYSNVPDLKHSVVTQIRALDRNYDGLIDHIYFADLGGQVWRADINNNADTDNFKIDRVVKVLDVSDQVGSSDAPPRFYERPLVTFYNGRYKYKSANNAEGAYNGVQAIVTVGTGDRSSPVSASRSKPDALYSVIDKDVSRNDLFDYTSNNAPQTVLRTPVIKVNGTSNRNDKLQELKFDNTDIGNNGIQNRMISNQIQGWYMPFTHWLGADAHVISDGGKKYRLKMFNEPDALAGVLISSSFNPDVGQEIKACSAGVRGETQRERTCLPYGACLDSSANGSSSGNANSSGSTQTTNRAFFNAGSGIVDNIISQYNDTSIFTSLKNRCEGDDCKPKVICPSGNCNNNNVNDIFSQCIGANCGVEAGISADKRINPLSWVEY